MKCPHCHSSHAHRDPCWESVEAFEQERRELALLADDHIHHVYPTFGREHVSNQRADCWCMPKVEFVEGGAIIIHEVEQ